MSVITWIQKFKMQRFFNRFFCVVLAVFLPVHLCSIYTFADDTIDTDNFYVSGSVSGSLYSITTDSGESENSGSADYYYTSTLLYHFVVNLTCTYIGDDVIDSNCVTLNLLFCPYLVIRQYLDLYVSGSVDSATWDCSLLSYDISCGLTDFTFGQATTSYNSHSIDITDYISSGGGYCSFYLTPGCSASVSFVDDDNIYFTQGSTSFSMFLTAEIYNVLRFTGFSFSCVVNVNEYLSHVRISI